MIALSGLAGATSWLFGFKALDVGGQVSQVAPIDKLSVPLAAVLAFFLLRDRPSVINWAGIVLITFGHTWRLCRERWRRLPSIPKQRSCKWNPATGTGGKQEIICGHCIMRCI